MYLIELILGWLIGKRNGGEYFFMERTLILDGRKTDWAGLIAAVDSAMADTRIGLKE